MPRALLSVYDKAGVVDLARGLRDLGWELISSGGTARVLAEAGLAVTDVADLTGYPAILGHRVVTLHPKVHGGILADRDDPAHRDDLAAHDIEPIDLVVSNLYPFGTDPSVELIDIGGPTLVRAAAKNHAHVGIVTGPEQYDEVLAELRADGALSGPTRRRLARAAFAHTAAYDAAIVGWLDTVDPPADGLPPTLHLALERAQELRYGENPHQHGARYRTMTGRRAPAATAVVVGRRRPARRQGAVLPQPLRRGGGLAARPRPRGPSGGGRRQARQPLRRGGGRRPRDRLRQRPRRRPGLRLRRHRGGEPPDERGGGGRAGSGVHRGGGGPRLRARRAGGADRQEEPPRAARPGLPHRPTSRSATSTAACWCRPPTGSRGIPPPSGS